MLSTVASLFLCLNGVVTPSPVAHNRLQEPRVIALWQKGAPGSEDRRNEAETKPNPWSIGNIHNPTLTVFAPPPEKATGAAVIIAPGGGHRELVFGEEGTKPGEYFSRIGVTAFVLKYRLGRESGSKVDVEQASKADGSRAVRMVRSLAKEYNLDPKKIGMVGFSAGGEVLSFAAFGPGGGDRTSADPIDQLESRPDFAVWIYPGPVGIPEVLPESSPEAFILTANDDGAARITLELVAKYRAAKRPVELHLPSSGGHGFNMGSRSKLRAVNRWPDRLQDWMIDRGILPDPKL